MALPPQIKERLSTVARERGMTQLAMFSRLATWFAAQPPMVQSYVLGHLPDSDPFDMAKIISQQLAERMQRGARTS